MKNNALSVANYIIDLASKDSTEIRQLLLMKLVYIAHGFSLAITGQSLLNSNYDRVEAWKYGPVIPSVYHSFKQYKNLPITEKTVIAKWNSEQTDFDYCTPTLEDSQARKIVDMVWKRYGGWTGPELVNLTHQKGTPWSICYQENRNIEIPDEITKLYYQKIVEAVS